MRSFRPGSPVVAGGVTLIPVERLSIWRGPLGFNAEKDVFAIVYRSPLGLRALDMEGCEKPLEEVPELASMMEAFVNL